MAPWRASIRAGGASDQHIELAPDRRCGAIAALGGQHNLAARLEQQVGLGLHEPNHDRLGGESGYHRPRTHQLGSVALGDDARPGPLRERVGQLGRELR